MPATPISLSEMPEIRWRLALAGWHQLVVSAQVIEFLADEDIGRRPCTVLFGPIRELGAIASIGFQDRPRPCESVVDQRNLVVQEFWIGLVEIDALLDD